MNPSYPFTEQQMQQAYDEWGCNCGPSALAFALQIGLDKVRVAIPGFDEKRYTSPTMMKVGLANLGKKFKQIRDADGKTTIPVMFSPHAIQLVRVQWTGPWCKPGANPKWAYRQTHWIATWAEQVGVFVFDCNGGIRSFDSWQKEIVPALVATYPRADGGWFPTHVWRPEGFAGMCGR